MRGLLLTWLLLAAAGTYAEYLMRRSVVQWEDKGESGMSQELKLGSGVPLVVAVPDAASGDGLLTLRAEGGGGGSGSGSGSGRLPFINIELPVCSEDELLEFNGTNLVCKKIPERKCICPEPMSGSGDMVPLPEPPGGCRVFQPPEGGAFVCLRMADFVIYCSVLCDINREFSTFPVNPYLCGVPSDFKWSDFTNVTHYELPKCTGFRHTLRTLHREQFYLPRRCNQLNATEINTVKKDFCCLLNGIPYRSVCEDITCDTEDIYIQCPP